MQYDEFMRRVCQRTGLPKPEAAQTVEVTFRTLSECLSDPEAWDAASQLPAELKDWLRHRDGRAPFTTPYEFYNRVSSRLRVNMAEAQRRADAVIEVFEEAVTPGQIEHIIMDLRGGLRALFASTAPQAL